MEHPDLFYDLPCAYNYQLDDSMNRKEYAGLFHLYHNCSQHPKIYHANGGVEIPDDDEDAKNRQWNNDKTATDVVPKWQIAQVK